MDSFGRLEPGVSLGIQVTQREDLYSDIRIYRRDSKRWDGNRSNNTCWRYNVNMCITDTHALELGKLLMALFGVTEFTHYKHREPLEHSSFDWVERRFVVKAVDEFIPIKDCIFILETSEMIGFGMLGRGSELPVAWPPLRGLNKGYCMTLESWRAMNYQDARVPFAIAAGILGGEVRSEQRNNMHHLWVETPNSVHD